MHAYQKGCIAAGLTVLLLAALLLAASTRGYSGGRMGEGGTPAVITGSFRVDGGEPQPFAPEALPDDGRHHTLEVRGHLAQTLAPGATLNLCTTHMRVSVALNGATLYAFGEPGSYPAIFSSAGSVWTEIALPALTETDELIFTLYNFCPSRAAYSFTQFFAYLSVGADGALLRDMAQKSILPVCLGVFNACVGVAALVVAYAKKRNGLPAAGSIAAYGAFAAAGGVYVFMSGLAPYYSLVIPNPFVVMLVNVLCMPAILLTVNLMFLITLQNARCRRILRGMNLADLLVAVAVLLIQLFSAVDIYQLTPELGAVFFINLLLLAYASVTEWRSGGSPAFRMLLWTLLPLVLCAALESVNSYFDFMPHRIAIPGGIVVSTLLQILRLARLTRDEGDRARRMQRMEAELTENRIAVALSQIQPHFLYNALNAIQNLCRKDPALAAKAVGSFAEYLRGNLDAITAREPIRFEQELEHIKRYMELQLLRFGDRVKIVYDLETTDFTLPVLSVQPLVENAVRYGATKRREGGTVTLRTRETPEAILITVQDDGAGFLPGQVPADGRTHVGIENVQNRLRLQCGGSLTIGSRPGETVATVTLPKAGRGTKGAV